MRTVTPWYPRSAKKAELAMRIPSLEIHGARGGSRGPTGFGRRGGDIAFPPPTGGSAPQGGYGRSPCVPYATTEHKAEAGRAWGRSARAPGAEAGKHALCPERRRPKSLPSYSHRP